MPTIGARLRHAREQKGWSQTLVCRKLGISNSAMSGYERDYREPDAETLSRLAKLYEVSLDWLINGNLSIINHAEKSELTIDNALKKSDNSTHIDIYENGFRNGVGADFFPIGRLVNVPIVAEISCGDPIFTEDNIIGTFPVDSSIVPISQEGEHVWVKAKGDSMVNANIVDGSLVLLHIQPEVENGDIAAVCVDNDKATLKKVFVNEFVVTLIPENPSMAPMTYERRRVRIVAKAIWVASKL